ncbi:hypothetical protein ZWY2020_009050, partial [Hordeum vulgare]
NIWKKKTYFSIVQSYSLVKSRSFSSPSIVVYRLLGERHH